MIAGNTWKEIGSRCGWNSGSVVLPLEGIRKGEEVKETGMAIKWAFSGPQILQSQGHERKEDTWPRINKVSQACKTHVPADRVLVKWVKAS